MFLQLIETGSWIYHKWDEYSCEKYTVPTCVTIAMNGKPVTYPTNCGIPQFSSIYDLEISIQNTIYDARAKVWIGMKKDGTILRRSYANPGVVKLI